MTDGVEEDSKTYSRLELRFRRAESQRESLAFVEVVNEKVEMKTLGLRTFGPCGGSDVGDLLKPDGRVTIAFKSSIHVTSSGRKSPSGSISSPQSCE